MNDGEVLAPDKSEPRLSQGYTIWISVLALLGLFGVGMLGLTAMLLARRAGGSPSALAIPALVWAYEFVLTAPLALLRIYRWRHAASATFVHSLVMLPLNILALPGLVWIFTGLKREREWQRWVLSDPSRLEGSLDEN